MNIYVANVPFKANDDELRELFEEFGEVASARIIMDKFTGKSRGFAFVEMPNDDEAKQAISQLNDFEFMGKVLVVNEARPREDRPRTGGGGGFGGGGGGGRDGNRGGGGGGGSRGGYGGGGGGGRDNDYKKRW
jgi:RNA recognition motif-containing protein